MKKILNRNKPTFLIVPAITYLPETSWSFGVSGKIMFKFKGADSTTRTSSIYPPFYYTLNKQIFFEPAYTLFFNKEKYVMKGQLGYIKFPQLYFGIGKDNEQERREMYAYKMLKFKHVILRKIKKSLFLGLGYKGTKMYDVEHLEGGLLATKKPLGYKGGKTSGVIFSFLHDSRNKVVNASKGFFLEVNTIFHSRSLGSDFNYASVELDFRKYYRLFKDRPDVFGLQLFGKFTTTGTPFNELATIGGEYLMRGFYKGRYRDFHCLSLQAEYRMHIWDRLGLTFFASAGDVAGELSCFSVKEIKFTYGVGLRIKLDKKSGINARVDCGFMQKGHNFYMGTGEVF